MAFILEQNRRNKTTHREQSVIRSYWNRVEELTDRKDIQKDFIRRTNQWNIDITETSVNLSLVCRQKN